MNLQAYLEEVWKQDGSILSAPVTLLVEGVHRGSHGAIYHSAKVLEKATHLWEGVNLTLGHPQVDGNFVSIHHSPEIEERYTIGKVTAPYWDSEKKAIRATVKISANEPQAKRLMKLREVSVGIFGDETEIYGQFYGESYNACALTHVPDHLAVLPEGVRGACSVDDGCGIRTNALQNALTTYVNNLIGGNTMIDEMLLPPGVEGEDYRSMTETELRTLQYEADEGEGLLLPPCLNGRNLDCQGGDDDKLLPPGVE
jgi:hypothetical protein